MLAKGGRPLDVVREAKLKTPLNATIGEIDYTRLSSMPDNMQ